MYLSTFYDEDHVYFMFDIPSVFVSDYNLFIRVSIQSFLNS